MMDEVVLSVVFIHADYAFGICNQWQCRSMCLGFWKFGAGENHDMWCGDDMIGRQRRGRCECSVN